MASTFSVDDVRLLEKTISIRERIIDNFLEKNNLPTKARDLEAITNTLESMDRSIFTKAKISIEESSARVSEETKEVLKDLLLNLHKNTSPFGGEMVEREIPRFSSQGIAINEGELITKIDTQDVNQFLENIVS